jgi:hypothetical protein
MQFANKHEQPFDINANDFIFPSFPHTLDNPKKQFKHCKHARNPSLRKCVMSSFVIASWQSQRGNAEKRKTNEIIHKSLNIQKYKLSIPALNYLIFFSIAAC